MNKFTMVDSDSAEGSVLIKDPDPIDQAIEAYRNRTPESVLTFRKLTDDQAATVVRILKAMARGPKKAK